MPRHQGSIDGLALQRPLELTPTLDGHDHRTHAIALGEHQLLDLAVLQLREHRAEVPHRLTDGAELVGADPERGRVGGQDETKGRRYPGRMTTVCRRGVAVPSETAVTFPLVEQRDDTHLVRELASGNGAALEPLMERWGDAIVDTCFRAVRDGERAYDLYGEVWAEAYMRIRLGTERLPESFGPWAVGIIGSVLKTAAEEGRIPVRARMRMKLAPTPPAVAELARLEHLRDPTTLRDARAELPPNFSAAADRMLLRVSEPAALSRIQLSTPWSAR